MDGPGPVLVPWHPPLNSPGHVVRARRGPYGFRGYPCGDSSRYLSPLSVPVGRPDCRPVPQFMGGVLSLLVLRSRLERTEGGGQSRAEDRAAGKGEGGVNRWSLRRLPALLQAPDQCGETHELPELRPTLGGQVARFFPFP
jgi:hypothetical protein